MKNENKCFFSIRLENGITITGENPYEVYNYLLYTHYAINSIIITNNKTIKEYKNIYKKLRDYICNAIITIQNHKK